MVRWSSSIPVFVGRILLLSMAASAAGAALWLARAAESSAAAGAGSYVCPMHPEVRSTTPGDCPICKMELEPISPKSSLAPAGDGTSPGTIVLPEHAKLFRFQDVAMAKHYTTALEMRVFAWLESSEQGAALVHTDQALLLTPGEKALFSPSSPDHGTQHGIDVEVSEQPFEKWDAATVLVRFRIDPGAGLAAGQTGQVKFPTRLRKGLVVKASAVRKGPEGPYVLVVGGDRRTLSKRPIEVGSTLYGYAAVVSGLNQGELVAARHTFTLDAERRAAGGGQ